MANKSFNNLDELELYLQKNIHEILNKDVSIERILAETMSQAVVDVVYAAYDPISYERRGDESGLSDIRNMVISSVSLVGNQISLIFENLTEGADSLKGEFIGDLIEYGEGYNGKHWNNPNSPYADARPFAEETANRLRENPTELLNALKVSLQARGFTVS
jgi:hypothetical protein